MPGEDQRKQASGKIDDISKGLDTVHRTGVSGFASREMKDLRNKVQAVQRALKGKELYEEEEEAEAEAKAKAQKKKKLNPEIRQSLKEAYISSLHYELAKRESNNDNDWEPHSEMGKIRMKSCKDIRKLARELDSSVAEEATKEFIRNVRKANHKYHAYAETTAQTIVENEKVNMGNRERYSAMRNQLRKEKKRVHKMRGILDGAREKLNKAKEDFEKSEREKNTKELDDIAKGLDVNHSGTKWGAVFSVSSSEKKALKKANDDLRTALKKANGNMDDPRVAEAMTKAYQASLAYEMQKRVDKKDKGGNEKTWKPKSTMGKEHMAASQKLRKFIAARRPDIAEAVNERFIEKNRNTEPQISSIVADYTGHTIAVGKFRMAAENRRKQAELNRERISLEREKLGKKFENSKKANDDKLQKIQDDIRRSLYSTHRGQANFANRPSKEMRELRNAYENLNKVIKEADGDLNDEKVIDAVKEAYKASLHYEVLKRGRENVNKNWQPSTKMGKTHLKASQDIRKFIIENCPDVAQEASEEFVRESEGKYKNTARAVVSYEKDAVEISLGELGRKMNHRYQSYKAEENEILSKRDDWFAQDIDLQLAKKQADVERKMEAKNKERLEHFRHVKEGLFSTRLIAGGASEQMQSVRKAMEELDYETAKADGDFREPSVHESMKKAYRAALEYELKNRKDNADISWEPGTDMGKERLAAARELRKFIAKNSPQSALNAEKEFTAEYGNTEPAKAVVENAEIRAAVTEGEKNVKDNYRNDLGILNAYSTGRRNIAFKRGLNEANIFQHEKFKAQYAGYEARPLSEEQEREFDKKNIGISFRQNVLNAGKAVFERNVPQKADDKEIEQPENQPDAEKKEPDEENKYESKLKESRRNVFRKMIEYRNANGNKTEEEKKQDPEYKNIVAEALAVERMDEKYQNEGRIYDENEFDIRKKQIADNYKDSIEFENTVRDKSTAYIQNCMKQGGIRKEFEQHRPSEREFDDYIDNIRAEKDGIEFLLNDSDGKKDEKYKDMAAQAIAYGKIISDFQEHNITYQNFHAKKNEIAADIKAKPEFQRMVENTSGRELLELFQKGAGELGSKMKAVRADMPPESLHSFGKGLTYGQILKKGYHTAKEKCNDIGSQLETKSIGDITDEQKRQYKESMAELMAWRRLTRDYINDGKVVPAGRLNKIENTLKASFLNSEKFHRELDTRLSSPDKTKKFVTNNFDEYVEKLKIKRKNAEAAEPGQVQPHPEDPVAEVPEKNPVRRRSNSAAPGKMKKSLMFRLILWNSGTSSRK